MTIVQKKWQGLKSIVLFSDLMQTQINQLLNSDDDCDWGEQEEENPQASFSIVTLLVYSLNTILYCYNSGIQYCYNGNLVKL